MIEVTELRVGEYKVPVPPGLTELLKDCWVKNRAIPKIVEEYESKTIRRDGQLITILSKKR